jgi:hypothetical protein
MTVACNPKSAPTDVAFTITFAIIEYSGLLAEALKLEPFATM